MVCFFCGGSIWLVKKNIASEVVIRLDLVDTTALICNERHFVRLTVMCGTEDQGSDVHFVFICERGYCAQMAEVRYARICARIVPLKRSPVKGASVSSMAA